MSVHHICFPILSVDLSDLGFRLQIVHMRVEQHAEAAADRRQLWCGRFHGVTASDSMLIANGLIP